MTTVRTAARRRLAKRLRYAGASRLAALSRETGVPVDVLRTFAGISDPRNAYRFTVAAFHARGERAWQLYLRDGKARPLDDVFDVLDARVAAAMYARSTGRREVEWSVGAELARGTTRVQFPPAPEPEEWGDLAAASAAIEGLEDLTAGRVVDDWEPSRLELRVEPADLSDDEGPP